MDASRPQKNRNTRLVIGQGKRPTEKPLKVREFYTLEKETIKTLIEAIKFFVTTAGIALSLYSQLIQRFIEAGLKDEPIARLLSFLPLILWLSTIVAGVIAIYPRRYHAETDLAKEKAVLQVRKQKHFWALVTIYLFILGFCVCVYMLAAELWDLYPFNCS